VGSPKLGNLGWCYIDVHTGEEFSGHHLDDLFPYISHGLKSNGLIIGLEAPLYVPLRPDLMLATKARKGEGRRPWSAGAGAQVLALNLPIMIYLLKGIHSLNSDAFYFLNEKGFSSKPNEIMFFEALVSGEDKGSSHINDAQIMAYDCLTYSKKMRLPNSILEQEENTEYFNLMGAALLRCDINKDMNNLSCITPIYKPNNRTI
jgi:hypothetical protein